MDLNTAVTVVVTAVTGVGGAVAALRYKIRLDDLKIRKVTADTDAKRLDEDQERRKVSRNDTTDEAWKLIQKYREIIESNTAAIESLRQRHADDMAKIQAQHEASIRACEQREEIMAAQASRYENLNSRIVERMRLQESYIAKKLPDWPFERFEIDHEAASKYSLTLPPEAKNGAK